MKLPTLGEIRGMLEQKASSLGFEVPRHSLSLNGDDAMFQDGPFAGLTVKGLYRQNSPEKIAYWNALLSAALPDDLRDVIDSVVVRQRDLALKAAAEGRRLIDYADRW